MFTAESFVFTRRKLRHVADIALAALLCGLVAGCAPTVPTLPEFKKPLPGEEMVTLNTRPGVTVRALVVAPKADPKGIFVLLPGGDGTLVGRGGGVGRQWLTRNPGQFAEQGFVGASIDVPSDQPYGFGPRDHFRTSKEHAEDVKKIIDFLSQRWPKPIFLLGHSRGTTSAAYLATVIKDQRIGGIVLAGSPSGRLRIYLWDLPLENIPYPVLFVHHREDNFSSFQYALQGQRRLSRSQKVGFIGVVGGGPPAGDPCEGSETPHNFSGKQREVVRAVTDWALGKPVPERIGP